MSHRNHEMSRTRRRIPVLIGLTAAGSLALASQVMPASAESVHRAGTRSAAVAQIPTPPAGEAWIQGALTDQAGHRLNNVNVEVWSTDTNATEPVASNLSYAGAPADGRHQNGVYRVAVPSGTPYILTFSTLSGQEDGDLFRAQAYGSGRPIATRSDSPSLQGTPVMAPAGRVINLGTTQMVRQGTVSSKTTARLGGKVKAGKRGKLTVRVTSPFVSNVTGKVTVKIGKKKLTHRLTAAEHGRSTINLPKLSTGNHKAVVQFQGTNTVAASKAKPVKVKVKARKK